jgi:hypothetical protein
MKQLSIEEKAEAYDKVVNKLKGFIIQGVDPLITRADVQDFFPELKESEDERIRNQIISFIEEYGNPTHCEWQKNWIAWLEKQHDPQVTDAEMKEILRTEYEKGRADTIAEMQKEWSDEDETKLRQVEYACMKFYGGDCSHIDWLRKVTRPQNTWKPSDDQMKALCFVKKAKILDPEERESLNSLYTHLRKLKEKM